MQVSFHGSPMEINQHANQRIPGRMGCNCSHLDIRKFIPRPVHKEIDSNASQTAGFGYGWGPASWVGIFLT